MSNNPYQAPEAALEMEAGTAALDLEAFQEPRRVAFGHGWAWIREAYGLFKRQPFLWIGMTISVLLVTLIFLPAPLGEQISYLPATVLEAGLLFAVMRADTQGGARFGDLFRGFRQRLGRLLGVGGFYVLGVLLAGALNIALASNWGLSSEMQGMFLGTIDPAKIQFPSTLWLVYSLVTFGIMIPFYMATVFAVPLVILNDVRVGPALRMSFVACLRNLLPLLLYSLAFIVLVALGALPLLLGWLVVFPLMFLSIYTAYRDIFYPATP